MPAFTTKSPQKERVILGLMTYGPDPTAGTRIQSLDEFKQHLDYFQSQGYNEIDTARMYVNGQQEAWTAKAGWKERDLTLATKVYPEVPGMHAPAELRKHFETSLRELRTECVDIFYLHAPDRNVPFEETMRSVNDLHKEGKFKILGLSNYPAWEVSEIHNIAKERGWVLPRIYQAMYNCFTREIESELIPCLRKYGMELVTYNPLCGGLFSGKIKSSDLETPPKEGRFSNSYQWGQLYRDRYLNDANIKALKVIEDVTGHHGLTMLETALRWTIHHSALNTRSKGGNDGVVVGVSNFQQLEENLRDFGKGPLPHDIVEALEKAWLITKATAPSYWR
ncbi:NADP-dependent oxidoreductase domain-containing protein [Paraphoma chrysanthemicola]|uniref:NADP-dependent oxidoreductase domain-containing protein n=1 Tax=Paraphoma chrysanthemicola TaxID=798071 RepID=A0A8K0QVY6_9PLEO|nr:NADP-dependent oxidoreductase domain-containing protein [Paraphoma chrysanthemicola]